ncbi:hypothetical protein CDL62_17100 [Alkalitalea saponilacus]|nr:hypothetical protein CDL62_17100 [Alkalitalea saponilacus]
MPVVSLILIITGCDPEVCNYYKICNSTSHKMSVLVYERDGIIREDHTKLGLHSGDCCDLLGVICGKGQGGAGVPFGSPVQADSIVIIFNDTIKVSILDSEMEDWSNNVYGNNSPLFFEAWTEVKSKKDSYYYEYEFTDWHYQKALEANGYAVE